MLTSLALAASPPRLPLLYAGSPWTPNQAATLRRWAQQTWRFFLADPNSATDLPRDALGFDGAPGNSATSPTDIAMYFWAVVAATQLHLISSEEGLRLARRELEAVARLETWHGFLLSWYDTATGAPLPAPGAAPMTSLVGAFISSVDNGWYASSLVLLRQAFPPLAPLADRLLQAMNFGRFYDPANGQLAGGYTVGQGRSSWAYGNLNTDPRIAIYMGIGTRTLPGLVWWKTWRTLPASLTWQTQKPRGVWVTYSGPWTHQTHRVYEGHYRYGPWTYVPSWGGSAFEALMAPLVVPEAAWGQKNFGLNDLNYAEASIADAHALGLSVWGLSPASVPGSSGAYRTYGAYPLGSGGPQNAYAHTAVAPYAAALALPWVPQAAYRDLKTLALKDHLLGPEGFFDSVDPKTGVIAPRYLILDQGMILASIDDALEAGGLQRYFAEDPVGRRVQPYLELERFSIQPVGSVHRGDLAP